LADWTDTELKRMRISVLGAGAWGTALASHAAQSHDVVLWGRDATLVAQMAAGHVNEAYLPGMALHAALRFEANLQAALDHAAGDDAMAIIASPVAGLAEMTRAVAAHGGVRNVIWLCKGFDPQTGALPHAIVRGAGADRAHRSRDGRAVRPELCEGSRAGVAVRDDGGLHQ